MKVMKFGGSCLQSREGLLRMIELVQLEPRPLVIVLSALKGVTDWLIQLTEKAAHGTIPDLTALRARHHEVLHDLEGEVLAETTADLDARLDELQRVLSGIAALGEVPERTRDRILGMGERMSVILARGHLCQQGLPAEVRVADEAGLVTTDEPGDARVLARAEDLVRERIDAGRDLVYVVPGFVGKTSAGHWTTLGRGGSDTTATFLAAALGGTAVLWKDTSGLLTGDPRVVAEPQIIEQLHYRDALELAHYGLPAVAQKAIHPARRAGIRIEIRSFLSGKAPSVIGDVPSSRLAISCVPEVTMVDLVATHVAVAPEDGAHAPADPGAGLVLRPLSRLLEALADAHVAPLLLTEASPAGETTLVVKEEHRAPVEAALAKAGSTIEFAIRDGLAAVSLIGSGMRGRIGFAASVFECLASEGINIDAIAQTATERNISVVVDREQATPAVRALHKRFVESAPV
jgi:aspartate kinase